MPGLTVRAIPETVMRQLRQAAVENKRSLNAQAVYWLEQAGRQWLSGEERTKLLFWIRSSRQATRRRHGRGSDSAVITRRMRNESAASGR